MFQNIVLLFLTSVSMCSMLNAASDPHAPVRTPLGELADRGRQLADGLAPLGSLADAFTEGLEDRDTHRISVNELLHDPNASLNFEPIEGNIGLIEDRIRTISELTPGRIIEHLARAQPFHRDTPTEQYEKVLTDIAKKLPTGTKYIVVPVDQKYIKYRNNLISALSNVTKLMDISLSIIPFDPVKKIELQIPAQTHAVLIFHDSLDAAQYPAIQQHCANKKIRFHEAVATEARVHTSTGTPVTVNVRVNLPLLRSASAKMENDLDNFAAILAQKAKDRFIDRHIPLTATGPGKPQLISAYTPEEHARACKEIDESLQNVAQTTHTVAQLFERTQSLHEKTRLLEAKISNAFYACHNPSPRFRRYFERLRRRIVSTHLLSPGLESRTQKLCERFGKLYVLEDRAAHFTLNPTEIPTELSILFRNKFTTLAQLDAHLKTFSAETEAEIAKCEKEYAEIVDLIESLNTTDEKKSSEDLIKEIEKTLATTPLTLNNKTRLQSIQQELKSNNHGPSGALRRKYEHIVQDNNDTMKRLPPARDTRVLTIAALATLASIYPMYKFYKQQCKYVDLLIQKTKVLPLARDEKSVILSELNSWRVRWIPRWLRSKLFDAPLVEEDIEALYKAYMQQQEEQQHTSRATAAQA